MSAKLPDFEHPPVVEVAMAVQFETLTALRTPQIGSLWSEFRKDFPKTEEHAPLEPMMERFGVHASRAPAVHVEMLRQPPVPRCWFLNEDGTGLIQVQQDRFALNWRDAGKGGEYRRYGPIRDTFRGQLERFAAFVGREGIGVLAPNQCELTYVNHIVSGEGWEKHGELGGILTLFEVQYTDKFLPELEEARVSGTYVIPDSEGKPLGRLRFSVNSAYRREDDRPIIVLNLVARGTPDGEGLDGVMKFLDIGHEWIVRGFAAITTPEMHAVWGRCDRG